MDLYSRVKTGEILTTERLSEKARNRILAFVKNRLTEKHAYTNLLNEMRKKAMEEHGASSNYIDRKKQHQNFGVFGSAEADIELQFL